MSAPAAARAPRPDLGRDFGSRGYRAYVLGALTFVYTLNFVDRILIGVVAQPIIEEFRLADWQFGLLSGFGFAFMVGSLHTMSCVRAQPYATPQDGGADS